MPLVRGHHSFDDHFTQIPNQWVRDNRLSLKAIGLLTQLMSHSPGWRMSIRSLAKFNGTGVDTIKSAIAELEKFGYLMRSAEQKREHDGTFADFEWQTQDPFQNPVTAKVGDGLVAHKEEQVIKEEQVKENKLKKEELLFDEFYKEYPRKEGRKPGFRAFRSALTRASFESILAGAIAYRSSDRVTKGFIKLPATWLNEDAWEDAATFAQSNYTTPRRERELEHSQELLAQISKQQKLAAPAPKCEHGSNVALCKTCIRN